MITQSKILRTKIARLAFEKSRQLYADERTRLTEWARTRQQRGADAASLICEVDAMLRAEKIAQAESMQ